MPEEQITWDEFEGFLLMLPDGGLLHLADSDDPFHQLLLQVLETFGAPISFEDAGQILAEALTEANERFADFQTTQQELAQGAQPQGSFRTLEEAQARVDELNSLGFTPQEAARDPNTGLFFVQNAPVVEEQREAEFFTKDGQEFIRQPSGQVTQPREVREEPEPVERTLDQTIDDLIIAGNSQAAFELADAERRVKSPQGLSDIEAAQIVVQFAKNDEEAQRWFQLLTGRPFGAQQQLRPPSITGGQPQLQQGVAQAGTPQLTTQPIELADPTGQGRFPQTIVIPGGLRPEQFNALSGQAQIEALAMDFYGIEEFIRRKNAGDTFDEFGVGPPDARVGAVGTPRPGSTLTIPAGTRRRTAEQQELLENILERQRQSTARGVATPRAAQQQLDELLRLGPPGAPTALRPPQIGTGRPQTAGGVILEAGSRRRAQRRQEEFVGAGVPRISFR